MEKISPLESPSIGFSYPSYRAAGVYTLCKTNADEKSLLKGQAEESRHPASQVAHLMGIRGCQAVAVTNAYANKILWSTFTCLVRDPFTTSIYSLHNIVNQ